MLIFDTPWYYQNNITNGISTVHDNLHLGTHTSVGTSRKCLLKNQNILAVWFMTKKLQMCLQCQFEENTSSHIWQWLVKAKFLNKTQGGEGEGELLGKYYSMEFTLLYTRARCYIVSNLATSKVLCCYFDQKDINELILICQFNNPILMCCRWWWMDDILIPNQWSFIHETEGGVWFLLTLKCTNT